MRPDWRRVAWRLRYRVGAGAASDLRRMLLVASHPRGRITFQGPAWLGPGFAVEIPDEGELVVGAYCAFRRRFYCEISGSGRVVIGAGTTFTQNSAIQCTTSIEIGEGCTFGDGVLLVDGSHRFRDPARPLNAQGYDYRPLKIGDGATVMAKSTVISDVGAGAFVGANSVVTRPVPPYCLAVGTPARVTEYFGPPELRPPDLALHDG